MSNLKKLIVIVGPTASGKSDLALRLAKWLRSGQAVRKFGVSGAEIVSADSRQIYRGMDIGTAKPNKKEMAAIKHHLIDIRNPGQDYSVGQFKKDAVGAINRIIKSGKLPILVGGTGLYIDAVVKNLEFPEVKENKKLRARLEREIKEKGLDFVFKKLVDLDPEAAYIVDPRNPRRVIRALEVALTSGKPFLAQRKTGKPLFDAFIIGIRLPGGELEKRIKERIGKMVKSGLLEEVKSLVKKYGPNCKPFDAISYREIIGYLKSEIGLDEAIEKINKNSWHYTKRQMTWFRRNKKIHWISGGGKRAFKLARHYLKG